MADDMLPGAAERAVILLADVAEQHQAGDLTVVDVPLRFEAAELTGRVSYDRAGLVAGLFFLNQR